MSELFQHTIRVRWSDCDPAQIVYTGRIPYFALEAIEAWWEDALGWDWYNINIDQDRGLPFVHMSLDFRSPITPRFELICEVRLLKIGESSVRFCVVGRQEGGVCFEGEFVEVFVAATAHKKMPIPGEMRSKLETLCVNL